MEMTVDFSIMKVKKNYLGGFHAEIAVIIIFQDIKVAIGIVLVNVDLNTMTTAETKLN